jgi:hypothetical protein
MPRILIYIMSNLTNVIKKCDIYGNYFQLRINNQTKFKTCSGGLLSIVTFVILILCVVSFGNDFFTKSNPKVTIEEGLYQDKEIPIINGTEYPLKPIMVVATKSFSNIGKLFTAHVKNGTSVKRYLDECKPAYIEQHFPDFDYKAAVAFSTLYCFQLNDYVLSKTQTVSLNYDRCKLMSNVTLSQFRSANITCDNASTLTISSMPITIYTQQLGFKPDIEKPFISKTGKYYFSFSSSFYTFINIYWNLQFLNDDLGWLIDDVDRSTELSPQTEQIGYTFLDKPQDMPYFSITFFLNDKFKRYIRTYQKLQDVLAALGGFMKLILTLLNLVSLFIRNYLIDMYIIAEKFESDRPKTLSLKDNRTTNKDLENSQQSNKILILELHNNYVDIVNTTPKRPSLMDNLTSKKITFCTYSQASLLNWFNCKVSKRKDEPITLLRRKLKVVNTFQDYSYILRKLNEFETLKKVLFNDKQLLCFDYLAKPYSSEIDPSLSQSFSTLFNSEQINKENLINYYIKVMNEEPLGGYDEKIFRYLNDEIKEEIMRKINKVV